MSRQEVWQAYRQICRLLWYGVILGKTKHRIGRNDYGQPIWRCTGCGADFVGDKCPQPENHQQPYGH